VPTDAAQVLLHAVQEVGHALERCESALAEWRRPASGAGFVVRAGADARPGPWSVD
jgi:hypothetical protein